MLVSFSRKGSQRPEDRILGKRTKDSKAAEWPGLDLAGVPWNL